MKLQKSADEKLKEQGYLLEYTRLRSARLVNDKVFQYIGNIMTMKRHYKMRRRGGKHNEKT